MTKPAPSPTLIRVAGLDVTLFAMFVASGFCGLLYQIVWVRLAFAEFGVITPVLSVVLSVFMVGLGIGTWLGGPVARHLGARFGISPVVIYAAAELLIGLGAFAVPVMFSAGGDWLLTQGASSSSRYLALSALFIAGALLPSCIMMGATLPLMMDFLRQAKRDDTRSFSFLYMANVIGAMLGTIATAVVLIEVFGFAQTWKIAAGLNVCIAIAALVLARRVPHAPLPVATAARRAETAPVGSWRLWVLFTTGFTSLALEVVWTRAFTFVLHTTIYAFAMILATYLLATWLGSLAYRVLHGSPKAPGNAALLQSLGLAVMIPVVLNDPGIQASAVIVLASILPACFILGYLTPRLVDEYSQGNPDLAGRCYGLNILGGILGPLVAGYLLLPFLDVRVAQIVLAGPILIMAAVSLLSGTPGAARRVAVGVPAAALLVIGAAFSHSYEEGAVRGGPREVHRDHVATVVAYGEGMDRGLLVNGTGIAKLTPITKVMAHLTLAEHGAAQSAVAICFGMGTTLRSMRSWGIEAVGVDLAQSVIDTFGFFHADAAAVAADPRITLIADDGRRFLQRAGRSYDVIAVDPPPPPEAAGSSLLYSTEFYEAVKGRLAPGGLMHQWLQTGNQPILRATLRSLVEAFPHVEIYWSVENWGVHVLASMRPIRVLTPAELLARMPEAARADLMEWFPGRTIEEVTTAILARRVSVGDILTDRAGMPRITDDRPYNEYYLLRHRGLMR
jgi:spermidine synthase